MLPVGDCVHCVHVRLLRLTLNINQSINHISRSLERLPRTLLTTVAFCPSLVVAHCGLIPMTCGSCSCRNTQFHIINLVS